MDVWRSCWNHVGVYVFIHLMILLDLMKQWIKQLNAPLEEIDPEIADIIELEKARQWKVYASS